MTASSMGCTPLFLNEVPQTTAVILFASTARRIAALMSATLISAPESSASIQISPNSSSLSARQCTSSSRAASAASTMSAGISSTV